MGCNGMDFRPEVSTIYNALLFFDRDGRLMGRRGKTMPTFTERMFWGQGDASDLIVFDTDIGRLGGLICGEHLMTLVRAAMIGLGEEIHVAVFPGAFALHTGPQLEEWDAGHQSFWGHASVRAHALEAGAFVLSACGQIDEADIPDDFPHKGRMNIGYARGGIEASLRLSGNPLVGPVEGPAILRAKLQTWMIKAWKAIIDTNGHYARPDLVGLRLSDRAPSQYPVLQRTQPRPALLAESCREKRGRARRWSESIDARSRSPRVGLTEGFSASASSASEKNSGPPKLPDFSASSMSPLLGADGAQHRHAGGDFRADQKAGNAQPVHHRAGGFAAGDHQPPHTRLDQSFGDIGHRLLDRMAGGIAAMARLQGRDLVRRRTAGDQDRTLLSRSLAQASARRASSLPGDDLVGIEMQHRHRLLALAICCSVACEQLPARHAAGPPTGAPEPHSPRPI